MDIVDVEQVTTYSHDARDRLSEKLTPQGGLAYSYDGAGNLMRIRSLNTAGADVNYTDTNRPPASHDATRNAKASVPRGEYPRHCSCKDTEGFRGVGHQCEAHTR